MYAAIIEIGWVKKCFEGNTPSEILQQVETYQDFGCLVRMGRMEEGKRGQKELDKLEAFLEKYYDETLEMSDIDKLDIHLTIGDFVCHGIAEGEEAIVKLKEKV